MYPDWYTHVAAKRCPANSKKGWPQLGVLGSCGARVVERQAGKPARLVKNPYNMSWTCQFLWILAPWEHMDRVLYKLAEDKARAIVVVPNWVNRKWWQPLMTMCTATYTLPWDSLYAFDDAGLSVLLPADHPFKLVACLVDGSLLVAECIPLPLPKATVDASVCSVADTTPSSLTIRVLTEDGRPRSSHATWVHGSMMPPTVSLTFPTSIPPCRNSFRTVTRPFPFIKSVLRQPQCMNQKIHSRPPPYNSLNPLKPFCETSSFIPVMSPPLPLSLCRFAIAFGVCGHAAWVNVSGRLQQYISLIRYSNTCFYPGLSLRPSYGVDSAVAWTTATNLCVRCVMTQSRVQVVWVEVLKLIPACVLMTVGVSGL